MADERVGRRGRDGGDGANGCVGDALGVEDEGQGDDGGGIGKRDPYEGLRAL